MTEGTVDEHVMEVLKTKDKGQSTLLEAVKAKVKRLGRLAHETRTMFCIF